MELSSRKHSSPFVSQTRPKTTRHKWRHICMLSTNAHSGCSNCAPGSGSGCLCPIEYPRVRSRPPESPSDRPRLSPVGVLALQKNLRKSGLAAMADLKCHKMYPGHFTRIIGCYTPMGVLAGNLLRPRQPYLTFPEQS
jgi:hypothetical protein